MAIPDAFIQIVSDLQCDNTEVCSSGIAYLSLSAVVRGSDTSSFSELGGFNFDASLVRKVHNFSLNHPVKIKHC